MVRDHRPAMAHRPACHRVAHPEDRKGEPADRPGDVGRKRPVEAGQRTFDQPHQQEHRKAAVDQRAEHRPPRQRQKPARRSDPHHVAGIVGAPGGHARASCLRV